MVVMAVDWFILSDRLFGYVSYFVAVSFNDATSAIYGI
jgi:hypothetical protein